MGRPKSNNVKINISIKKKKKKELENIAYGGKNWKNIARIYSVEEGKQLHSLI